MSESWSIYTDDFDEFDADSYIPNVLPSSIREDLNDPLPSSDHSPPPKEVDRDTNSQNEILTDRLTDRQSTENDPGTTYYTINFHPKRTQVCSLTGSLQVNINDYVITEADRGLDMGKIIGEATKEDTLNQKEVHKIIRIATQDEISNLPEIRKREKKSVKVCQTTVQEQRLNMKIIDAELQFDQTQLTFYYTTDRYIDFRYLVKVLFKTFGTRIWMVWYDGQAPVKDVFSQNDRKKGQMRKDRKKQLT